MQDAMAFAPRSDSIGAVRAAVVSEQDERKAAALDAGRLEDSHDVFISCYMTDGDADRARGGDLSDDLSLDRMAERITSEVSGVHGPHGIADHDPYAHASGLLVFALAFAFLGLQLAQHTAHSREGYAAAQGAMDRLLSSVPAELVEPFPDQFRRFIDQGQCESRTTRRSRGLLRIEILPVPQRALGYGLRSSQCQTRITREVLLPEQLADA